MQNQQQQYNRPRTLRANWTIEQAMDLESWHSLELENELAQQLTKEIDAEILEEMKCQINQET